MISTPAEPAYWLDNYGKCQHGPQCTCGKGDNPWLGRACPHWQPKGARSFAELLASAKSKGGAN